MLSRVINLRVTFIHQEGNKPAWELARRGPFAPALEFVDEALCPSIIRTLIRMEQLGVPYLRRQQENHEFEETDPT